MSEDNKVSLDELDATLVEDKIEINTDANPMESPAPVADGIHRMKLVIDEKSWVQKETKEGKNGQKTSYLGCKYYAVCIDPGPNENKRVFGQVNTLVFDGKSEMGYIILQALGGKNNAGAAEAVKGLDNRLKLAKAFQQCLASEPIVRIETKWSARYNAGTKEEPDYKTYLSGMKGFPLVDPKDPSKGYKHLVNVKGAGEISAQAQIEDFFPDQPVA